MLSKVHLLESFNIWLQATIRYLAQPIVEKGLEYEIQYTIAMITRLIRDRFR